MLTRENEFSTVDLPLEVEAAVHGNGALALESNSPRSNAQGISGATVLVSDEHYKHSLGIVRQLGRMGAHISIVAASKDSLVCRSRYCKEVILSSAATVEALVETTLQAV